ncbi:MAG TPA: cell division protein ZapE [Actinomycetes bacterium]|nr:cell division protein ZapE [Actinomycetes bacterium]
MTGAGAERPEAAWPFARLVDRDPVVEAEALVAGLVPPPLFAGVSFDSFRPDASEPSQAAAIAALQVFAERLTRPGQAARWWRRAPAPPEGRPGVYLDGGFGVGKTHLLASLWHVAPAPKAFATFVELTNAVGALGFDEAVKRLSRCRLLCVDEFELDDPGDTVLMSTLLTRLSEAGVHLAATSNTLPDRLGEERFAAADFLREIQALASQFDVIRIEGADFRHRGAPVVPAPVSESVVVEAVERAQRATLDDFDQLLDHLATVHPSRYGALVDEVDLVGWRNVRPIDDQAVALRFVVLVDRLYDRDVTLVASGHALDELFPEEMLRGGYRKKYFRALSRLLALAEPQGA